MKRIPSITIKNARCLRKNMTDVEQLLWRRIRRKQLRGYSFRRQHPIGQYIVDFVCIKLKIVIELDGGQHADNKEYDKARNSWIESQSFKVIRFWNNDVIENIEGVLQTICEYLPNGKMDKTLEDQIMPSVKSDYTKWRKNLFEDMTLEEISHAAMGLREKHDQ